MKASLEHLGEPTGSSIQLKEVIQSRFDAPYHFHPEFELTLIISGTGKRFVGNQITDFGPGDLVLLGENVPHCWQNHRKDWLADDDSPDAAQALVIHFRKDFLGGDFLGRPEITAIRQLLEKARGGLAIQGPTQDRVARELMQLGDLGPFPRMLAFLNMLHQLSLAGSDAQVIETNDSSYALSAVDLARINRVYAYVIANYTQEVHLDEVAHLANMTETAFCRYFKQATHLTYTDFVNQYRVRYAQKLLLQGKNVSESCVESGFENLSYFTRLFKRRVGISPSTFKKQSRAN